MNNQIKTLLFCIAVIGVIWYWQSSKDQTISKTAGSATTTQAATETQAAPIIEASEPANNSQELIDQCVAREDSAKYWQIDSVLIKTCADFGYSSTDYYDGTCQLPYPDMSQTMLIRRQQRVQTEKVCEQVYRHQ